MNRIVSGVCPPTGKGNDVSEDSKPITEDDMEVFFPSAVRVPSICERENSSERPRGERKQQSYRGIEPEGLGNAREVLTKRQTHEVGEIHQTSGRRIQILGLRGGLPAHANAQTLMSVTASFNPWTTPEPDLSASSGLSSRPTSFTSRP